MTDDLEARLREVLAERGRVQRETLDGVMRTIDALPARRRTRWRGPGLAIAATVILAVVGIALVALLRPGVDVGSTPVLTLPGTSPRTSPAGTTAQPPPVWAVRLAGHLDCDGPPSSLGSDTALAPAPRDPAATPDEALERFLRDVPSLPATGYTRPLVTGHWALHRYLVNGQPKVHAVSTNQYPAFPNETGWTIVGLRACDPSELAAPVAGSRSS